MKWPARILVAASLAIGGAAAASAGSTFHLSGSHIGYDDQSGEVMVADARISTAQHGLISADQADFMVQGSRKDATPHVVILNGHASLSGPGPAISIADGARYYPELDAIVASSITVQSLMTAVPSYGGLGDPPGGDGDVVYTCEGGSLRGDGVPIKGNRVCISGGYEIACSGNQVVLRPTQEPCGLP